MIPHSSIIGNVHYGVNYGKIYTFLCVVHASTSHAWSALSNQTNISMSPSPLNYNFNKKIIILCQDLQCVSKQQGSKYPCLTHDRSANMETDIKCAIWGGTAVALPCLMVT